MKNGKKILLAFILLSIIIISGCTSQPSTQTQPTCGNGIVEAGEECDNFACPSGKTCSGCKCESIAPPPLPE